MKSLLSALAIALSSLTSQVQASTLSFVNVGLQDVGNSVETITTIATGFPYVPFTSSIGDVNFSGVAQYDGVHSLTFDLAVTGGDNTFAGTLYNVYASIYFLDSLRGLTFYSSAMSIKAPGWDVYAASFTNLFDATANPHDPTSRGLYPLSNYITGQGTVKLASIDSAVFNVIFDTSIGGATGPYDTVTEVFTLIKQPSPVPLPAAVWLFGTALVGVLVLAKKKRARS